MHRLLTLIVPTLCAVSLYGGPVSCAATASLMVDTTAYTLNMVGDGNVCSMSGTFGSFLTTGYVVTVTASTRSDPVIDFGMNFSHSGSDPSVTLKITSPYSESGGLTPTIFTSASGILTDSSLNGTSFALPQSGNDIETVKINGNVLVTASPLNPGCGPSGTPGIKPCGPPTSMQTVTNLETTGSGTFEMDTAFVLSANASYNVTGSVTFAPEPATGVLLGAGLVAIAALARRRYQTATGFSRRSNV